MARSMLVVLIPVAFVAGLVGLIRPSAPDVRDVDWEPALESARQVADFAVLGPAQVPEGWTVTRVALEPGPLGESPAWRMSLVTDRDEYVGLVQRAGDLTAVVRAELPEFVPEGTSLVAGQSWQQYTEEASNDPDQALVLEAADSVVVVLTSADDYSLAESFAESLR